MTAWPSALPNARTARICRECGRVNRQTRLITRDRRHDLVLGLVHLVAEVADSRHQRPERFGLRIPDALLRDHHGVAVNKVVGPFELSWAEIERDKADLKAQRSGYPIATAT
jgi:hypothetical protein